ncbi:MAG TPA: hypothetical protein VGX21_19490, partial [Methylomirabilota bacterium]|nr:hypothetical protein [Methylomirabilota bacterium]
MRDIRLGLALIFLALVVAVAPLLDRLDSPVGVFAALAKDSGDGKGGSGGDAGKGGGGPGGGAP